MTLQTILTIISMIINVALVVGGFVFWFGGEKKNNQHLDTGLGELKRTSAESFKMLEEKIDNRFAEVASKIGELGRTIDREVNRLQSRHNRFSAQFIELRTHIAIMADKVGHRLVLLESGKEEKENEEA